MGFAKKLWMEEEERGWTTSDKSVCTDCVDDPYLKTIVLENLTATECSYCLRSSDGKEISSSLDVLMKPISAALHRYFEEPNSAGLPWSEGNWAFDAEKITYTEDALYSLPLECHPKLFEDISSSFHNDAWLPCAKGSWLGLHPHEELIFSWKNFVEMVSHQSRYFFARKNLENDEESGRENYYPLIPLNQIGTLAYKLGLVKPLKKGTILYRVRKIGNHPPVEPIGYDIVGPPPESAATAGRMNPAGISYFYLAKEKETAFAEMLDRPPCDLLLATFKSQVDLFLLDLTDLPVCPSIFDEEKYLEREGLLFMSEFACEIAKPVMKDGREHVDYVPSQIISEYFSQVFQGESKNVISGIIYPSAVRPRGKNIVLFPLWRSPATRINQWEEILPLYGPIERKNLSDWDEINRTLSG